MIVNIIISKSQLELDGNVNLTSNSLLKQYLYWALM